MQRSLHSGRDDRGGMVEITGQGGWNDKEGGRDDSEDSRGEVREETIHDYKRFPVVMNR
ncbi:hypothetical protein [Massilibacteroides vaginae]|uniref:hypothetical protein n=1 Tax=Massilibacteroides vaginae TaxID=1673718 RepID=UPI001592C801|nr:hypothetical protein [Massilibacteroides vaginae]